MKILNRGSNYVVLSLRRRWRTNAYICSALVRIDHDDAGRVTRCTLTDPFPADNNGPDDGVAVDMLVEDLATQVRTVFTVLRFLGVGAQHWEEEKIEWLVRYTHPRALLCRRVDMCWDRAASRYHFPEKEESKCATVS